MNDQPVHIDIYSDVICPWCYVGKRRIERALTAMETEQPVQVSWRPFQLNPTMPADGVARREYLEAKFGSLDAVEQLEAQVGEAGRAEGITFAFDRIARTPNTWLAHRLIWFAKQHEGQQAMVETLFRGYFEEGASIGTIASLTALAERAGQDADAVGQFLATEAGTEEVKAEERQGHRLGVRAVPFFVFNGTYSLSGAHPVDRFVAALRAVRREAGAREQSAADGARESA